jgi:hypothetical protein
LGGGFPENLRFGEKLPHLFGQPFYVSGVLNFLHPIHWNCVRPSSVPRMAPVIDPVESLSLLSTPFFVKGTAKLILNFLLPYKLDGPGRYFTGCIIENTLCRILRFVDLRQDFRAKNLSFFRAEQGND